MSIVPSLHFLDNHLVGVFMSLLSPSLLLGQQDRLQEIAG
jgi:hypothetical protein